MAIIMIDMSYPLELGYTS